MRRILRFLIAACPLLPVLHAQVPLNRTILPLAVDAADRNVVWAISSIPSPRPAVVRSFLYRSSDQGRTWQALRIGEADGFPQILQISLDPDASGTGALLAAGATAATRRVYRFEEGGAAYTNISENVPAGFVTEGARWVPGGLLYLIGTTATGSAIVKSADGGRTFSQPAAAPCSIESIEINYRTPQQMFCADRPASRFRYSTDAGQSWQAGAQIGVQNAGVPGEVYLTSDGCQVMSDGVSNNPNRIVLYCQMAVSTPQSSRARRDLYFSSTDGLKNVTQLSWPTGLGGLAAAANRRVVYATGSQPVRTGDFGSSFVRLGTSLSGALAPDPGDATVVFAQASASGVAKSTDGGLTFPVVQPSQFIPALRGSSAAAGAGQLPIVLLDQTLEVGTAYVLNTRMQDIEGQPVSPTLAEWNGGAGPPDFIQTLRGAAASDPSTILLTAKKAAAGSFLRAEGTLRVGAVVVGSLRVLLEVTERIAPRLEYRGQAIAGTGAYTTLASVVGPAPGDGGPALSATLACCDSAMAVGSDTSLFFTEPSRIRAVSPSGTMSTYAGSGASGAANDGDSASQTKFSRLSSMVRVPEGLLVVDAVNRAILLVRTNSNVTNVIFRGPNTPSITFGALLTVQASNTNNVFLTATDGVHRSTDGGKTWQRLFPYSDIVAGTFFATPSGLAVDRNGAVLLTLDRTIVRWTPSTSGGSGGTISVVAGKRGTPGFAGDHGPASEALLDSPGGLFVDSRGNLFVTDGARVRVIYPDGVIQTVVGDGDISAVGVSSFPVFSQGLAIDLTNRLYAEAGARIYRFDPVTAGSGGTAAPAPQIPATVATPDGSEVPGLASFVTGQARTAPGAIFMVRGTNLTSGGAEASAPEDAFAEGGTGHLPRVLAGTSVLVNGVRAPLLYASAERLHVQMPTETTAPGTVRVQVFRDGLGSEPRNFAIAVVVPEILTAADGSGRAIVAADADLPRAGAVASLAMTGVGATIPAVRSGEAAPIGGPAPVVVGEAVLTIDGDVYPLQTFALRTNAAGIAMAVFQVPDGLAAGDHQIVISIRGEPSNTAILTTQ